MGVERSVRRFRGIGGAIFTNPATNNFVRVEIGAVARQQHQTELGSGDDRYCPISGP
jgi:hypothetical protein